MIQANLGLVKQNIEEHAKSRKIPGQSGSWQCLRTFPTRAIEEARSCGISYFGENRVQEAG